MRKATSTVASPTTQRPMVTSTEVPPTTEASGPQVYAWDAGLDMSGVIVQVSEPQLDGGLSDTERLFLDEGYRVFYVSVTIKNNSNTPFAYSPANFLLSDSQGQVFKVGWLCSEPVLESGTVQVGRTVKGAVPFEMPLDSEPAFIDYFPTYELIGTPEDLAGTWGG